MGTVLSEEIKQVLAENSGDLEDVVEIQLPPVNIPIAVFQVQRIYLKELTFEQPNSPKILLVQTPAQIQIAIETTHEQIDDTTYECLLKARVSSRIDQKLVFNIVVEEAGIFEIKNIPEDQLPPLLAITCPGMILPSLRYNIADLLTRAGFPPINLTEINFRNLYEQNLKQ